MITILGISGSLRKASFNTTLLKTASKMVPNSADLNIFPINKLPLYNDDTARAQPNDAIKSFRDAIQEADGVLIASPEYNYSFTGVLKNALDWAATHTLGNLLIDKPTAIMGASQTYYGTIRGQLHLRQVLLAADADVLRKPEIYVRRMQKLIDENGQITDKRTLDKIQTLVDAFLGHITNVK